MSVMGSWDIFVKLQLISNQEILVERLLGKYVYFTEIVHYTEIIS